MKIAVIGIDKIISKPKKHELNCQEIYTKIADRGHQVDIFAQSRHHQKSYFSACYCQKIRIITLIPVSKNRIFLSFNQILNTIWATFGKYDVIHIYGMPAASFAWFPKFFSTAKVIFSCTQLKYLKNSQGTLSALICRWMEKIAVKNAHEIIVDSKVLEIYFRQNHSIIPNYIPLASSSIPINHRQLTYGKVLGLEDQKYLLYLDKLEPEQKPDLLIKAFQSIKPIGWKLVLIGELGSYPNYASQLLSMSQQNDIIFVNDTGGYSLSEIIRNAGLLVVPSNKKNLEFPRAILKAMKVGLPVLASDIEVHQEIIGKNRGLLFTSGSRESLICQLQYALKQPVSLLKMAENAQTYVAIHHNWDRVIYKHLFLYLRPISSTPKQHSSYRPFP